MSTSRSLPFEYLVRGTELSRLDGQELSSATEQRDRELEDFLARLAERLAALEGP